MIRRVGAARRLVRALARVLVLGLTLGLGVGVMLMAIQASAEQQERAVFPPPGRLVDAGDGQMIHLRTWGTRRAGEPALILDVSASFPSSAWAWIGQMLGDDYFVVAYDRPGMAWSTGPKRPRDAGTAASALGRALDAANIVPPYLVVGHSYGGFSARAFTALRPADVAGLVLLDTTHPDGGGEQLFAAQFRARAWQGHAGLFVLSPPPNSFATLPEAERAAAHAVSHWTTHLDTTAEELEAWPVSAAQIRDVSFGDLPLLVVSVSGGGSHEQLQRDLLGLSTRSRFVALDADHVGMLLDHDQALEAAGQIELFVRAAYP